jgi:hypothetical protein
LAAAALLGAGAAAQASPLLVVGVDGPRDGALVEKTQYFYSGHDYCFYDNAWRGPGFYWCGYAWRRGWGWGGPAGWRGWAYGPTYWRGGSWVGPRGYGHREWGGWRGERDWHGGGDRGHGRH